MAVPAPVTVRPDGVSPSLGLLRRTRAQGPGGRGARGGPPRTGKFGCVEKRPTANWSVLGGSKSLGGSKTGPRALGGPTGTRPRPCPPGRAFQDVWGPGRNPSSSRYIFGMDHGGVEGGTQVPGYISGPEVDPHCRATARAPGAPRCPARPASPWPSQGRGPGRWVGRAGAPNQLASFGCVEKFGGVEN